MVFNSLTYLVFLLLVFSLYWCVRGQFRTVLLFFASLTFYAFWRVDFLCLILLSIIVDYAMALKITRYPERKHLYLGVSIVLNLGFLLWFKYFLFLQENVLSLAAELGIMLPSYVDDIILPLGISFYTFQTLSYTVDVYRGRILPEKNFFVFGNYVTFFPQLVAGPILRGEEVIPQLKILHRFQFHSVASGIRRILFGLFLKVVLADQIAGYVNHGFNLPSDRLMPLDVWTLSFLFGLQIYFDFSAYSHIAIGSARLFGLEFPENFSFPYGACSPREFWKRWHISLSSWIRDYVYLPLMGSQPKGKSQEGIDISPSSAKRRWFALWFTWVLMGFWHGAAWTFLLWGLYHAMIISLYRLFVIDRFEKFPLFGIVLTLPVMMLGWIPFRSTSLDQTFTLWGKIFSFQNYGNLGLRENVYLVAALLTAGVLCAEYTWKRVRCWEVKDSLMLSIGDVVLTSILVVLVFTFLRPLHQFIYFQF